MSMMGERYDELREIAVRTAVIRVRIEKRYAKLKSFSPVMRRAFAERDVAVALVAAGLPLPWKISSEEKLQRALYMVRRDRSWTKMLSPEMRRAVFAELARVGE